MINGANYKMPSTKNILETNYGPPNQKVDNKKSKRAAFSYGL